MSDGNVSDMESGLPLAEAVRQLRAELLAATEEGQAHGLKFTVESVDLELNLVLDTRSKYDGGLSLWKVSAGGGREKGRQETHRMTLRLKPQHTGGGEGSEVNIQGHGEY
ncbi:trypco2 family protein [Actinomadura sp. 7K507]|uniref:trypco2 family protein n=1 Tax=Actinomadura sp. 7K507 TaxID=2530365 RepID=UPI00104A369B|nr:trypco2 family protein [Actinomadura sp. 7K507]TDC85584.1 hypothetical protein E1285_24845 [Actinomadura sp. 7K507]